MSVTNAWCGALTSSGITVGAKVTSSATASCRLAVSTNPTFPGGSTTYFGPFAAANNYVKISATGLAADTRYFYAIEDAGVLDTVTYGQFQTVGPVGEPYSFRFAHAACAGGGGDTAYPVTGATLPNQISNSPVFSDIRASNPQLFIHSGDLHYYNITNPSYISTNALSSWRTAFDDVLRASYQHTLYRETPLVYIYDNHDSAQPTSSDDAANRHAAGMSNASLAYRERVPSYPLAIPTGPAGIHHSFQIGRVAFMCTDSRYYRDSAISDPAPRAYFGSTQLSWMSSVLAAFAAGSAEYLIWVQTQNWANNGPSDYNWGSYPEERLQIKQMLADNGWLGKMLTLAGDTHAMAWTTGADNYWGNFPVFINASLDSNQSAGPTFNIGRQGSGSGGVRGQWGCFDVIDNGKSIRIKAQGRYLVS